ncbi:hypothetical protein ABW21_db0203910 [Orbilia brochopaga]|nr:hypothetical protein ABW21_db0203910 [Drechslerella brochopaga]
MADEGVNEPEASLVSTSDNSQRVVRKRVSYKNTTEETLMAEPGSHLSKQAEAHQTTKPTSKKRTQPKSILANDSPAAQTPSDESPSASSASSSISSPTSPNQPQAGLIAEGLSLESIENISNRLKDISLEEYKTKIPDRKLTLQECADLLTARLKKLHDHCDAAGIPPAPPRLPPSTEHIQELINRRDQREIQQYRDQGRSITQLPEDLLWRRFETSPAFLEEYVREMKSQPADSWSMFGKMMLYGHANPDQSAHMQYIRNLSEERKRIAALRAAAFGDKPPPGYTRPPAPSDADWEAFLKKKERQAHLVGIECPDFSRELDEAHGVSHIKNGDDIMMVPPGMNYPTIQTLYDLAIAAHFEETKAWNTYKALVNSTKAPRVTVPEKSGDKRAGTGPQARPPDTPTPIAPDKRAKIRRRRSRRRSKPKKFVPQLGSIAEEDEDENMNESEGEDENDTEESDAEEDDDSEGDDSEDEDEEDEDEDEEDDELDSDLEDDEEAYAEFDSDDGDDISEDGSGQDDADDISSEDKTKRRRRRKLIEKFSKTPPLSPETEKMMMDHYHKVGVPILQRLQREYEEKQLRIQGTKKVVKPVTPVASSSAGSGVKRRVNIHSLAGQDGSSTSSKPSTRARSPSQIVPKDQSNAEEASTSETGTIEPGRPKTPEEGIGA